MFEIHMVRKNRKVGALQFLGGFMKSQLLGLELFSWM